MRKIILITGGAGFIGSHVTELLCDQGYEVRVIDDLSFGYESFVDKRATFIKGSIGDRKLIESSLEGVTAVIHLAASSIIKLSFEDPLFYYKNNVSNALILLEAMRKQHIKKIIFSSTAAVYGNVHNAHIPEDAIKEPETIYGSSKLAFENTLAAYYHAFGIESVILRFFNAYGPRDQQRPATRAVPVWIDSILHDRAIPLFWQGKQLRDYIYVKDIARAHLAVLPVEGHKTYNIGSGTGVYMKDIIKILGKISAKKMTIRAMGERKGDPDILVADISKIKKEVGWEPQVSLKEGLEETYKYYERFYQTNI